MKYDWHEIEPKMKGNWQALMMSVFNLHPDVFNGRQQACPHCGGKDRFRFDNNMESPGDGGAYCNQCGSASGITWAQRMGGMNFFEALECCANWLNLTPQETRKPIMKPVGSRNTSPQLDPEAVEEIMKRFTLKTVSKWTVSNGLGCDIRSDGEKMAFELFLPHRVPAFHESFTGHPCNVACIHRDGHVSYEAGKGDDYIYGRITRGSVTPVGENNGKAVYLCVDYADAWHVHYLTNAQVWCCWTPENMEQVAWAFPDDVKSNRLRGAVNLSSDELCATENGFLRVVIPMGGKTIKGSRGLYRRLYEPSQLINDTAP